MEEMPSSESRNWSLAAHLLGVFAGLVIPFGGLLGPLVVWLVKKEDDSFVAHNALEALNFQLTLAIAALVAAGLVFTVILMPVGLILLLAVACLSLWFGIQGAIQASGGAWFEYPSWAPRLIS